ncbi:MAG: OadG family protein [Gammaproteobacteria bacterium]
MAIEELLIKAVELMILGMGSVFIILTLMVGLILATSRILGTWFPEEPVATGAAPRPAAAKGAEQDDSELVAVIQAAIHRYRASHH